MLILRWFNFPGRGAITSVLSLTFMLCASVAMGQTCTQIKVTAHPDYPPFAWATGASGDGALIRVAERFSRAARIPMVFEASKSWEDAQRRTINGETDLILGLYRTPQRESELHFIDRPITLDPIGVFVRHGQAEEIDDIGDLLSLKGAAVAGESFGADFDLRIAKQLMIFRTENLTAAFKFLIDNQADYVLSGLYPGLALLRQMGPQTAPGKSVVLTQAALIPSQPLYAAFSRKSQCLALAPTLESTIERLTARGDMEGLTAEALMRWSAGQQK